MGTRRPFPQRFGAPLVITGGICTLLYGLRFASAQVELSVPPGEDAARGLTSDKVDKVFVYRSPLENATYLAFTTLSAETTAMSENLWLYRESGHVYDVIWQKYVARGARIDFVGLPNGRTNGLAVDDPRQCGSDGCSRVLDLFVLEQRKDYSIWFHDDGSADPVAFFEEDDNNAQDAEARAWLQSWARKLGIYPQSTPEPELSKPQNIEEAWRHDNGSTTKGLVKLRYYTSLPTNYLPSFRNASGLLVTASVNQIEDDRYEWSAYFKAGVLGYDRATGKYFMIYLPRDRSEWVRKLAIRGPWLLMATECFSPKLFSVPGYKCTDRDCEWELRFNKQTHVLEKGRFDGLFQGTPAGQMPAAQDISFWTSQENKSFRPGTFSPTVHDVIRAELQLLESRGFSCTFGGYADSCWSGFGSISLAISKTDGTEALEVIGVASSPQGEEGFLTLSQIAVLMVNCADWKQYIEPGRFQLREQYEKAARSSLRLYTLNHVGEAYRAHLTVMNREAFRTMGMMMAMEAGLGQNWEGQQLPNCMYWVLSIRPRVR